MAGWIWVWICLGLSHFSRVDAAISQQRSFHFLVNELVVKPLAEDVFEELNCKLTKFRFVSCNMIVRRNIDQIKVEATLDLLRPNNQTKRLYNVLVDACQFLSIVHKNQFFNIFAKSVIGSFKGNMKCPVIAHFNYTVTDFHLDETDFPKFLPKCQFRAISKYYTKNKAILSVVFGGRILHN